MCYSKNMNITFNKKKLDELLINFYNCSGISISIFNSEYVCIANAGSPQQFCNKIREDEARKQKCALSDESHFKQVNEEHKTIIYTCHAGIVETITPIFYENIIIAYVMLGRFRDAERKYSSHAIVRKSLSKYGLKDQEKEYLKLYKQLPVFSVAQLNSAISILKLCIRYIWNEKLIKLNKNMLPTKIENFILENLSSELTIKNICKEFFISKEKLYSIFREEYNDTVKNFINNKRIQQAEKLLGVTTAPIANIAEQVGFSDYNYFIRLFKKKTNLSPLQYRKKNPPN